MGAELWWVLGCDIPKDHRLLSYLEDLRFQSAFSADSAKKVQILYNLQSDSPLQSFSGTTTDNAHRLQLSWIGPWDNIM